MDHWDAWCIVRERGREERGREDGWMGKLMDGDGKMEKKDVRSEEIWRNI